MTNGFLRLYRIIIQNAADDPLLEKNAISYENCDKEKDIKIQKKIRENAIEGAKERTIYRNASYRPSQLRILVIAYYLHATCVSIYLTREISKEGSLMTSPHETRVSTIDYLLP